MKRTSITVDGLHHGGQPIPIASRVGNVIASGGISGIDRSTGAVAEAPQEQVRLVFENLRAVLQAAGADAGDIVKLTFYVADRSLRDAINLEWVAMFPDPASRPARHTLVQALPEGLLVQCEVLAVAP
jgi:enamine deaminase RidA (YjgF/YER057c/UK114 family)